MKITILGTGAIGYPLAFCNCENCNLARKHKGKSIRKRASILINEDLLIDLGPDVQTSMNMYDKNMNNIQYLLQTHIHTDHYDPGILTTRIPYMVSKNQKTLELYTHPKCLNVISKNIFKYEKVNIKSKEGSEKLNVYSNPIISGEKVEFGNYKVKAIDCNHDKKHGSLLYVVSQKEKHIFYATDTPALTDKALEQLKEFKLDVVLMDHTFGDKDYSFSHLNEKLFIEQIEKMKNLGIIDNNTKIYATHISHDGNSYHEIADKRAISKGYNIAYDGLEIEI